MAKNIKVLVLVDEPAHGLKCGTVVSLEEGLAKQLKEAGRIDTNSKAVAAAEAAGGDAVTGDDVIEE